MLKLKYFTHCPSDIIAHLISLLWSIYFRLNGFKLIAKMIIFISLMFLLLMFKIFTHFLMPFLINFDMFLQKLPKLLLKSYGSSLLKGALQKSYSEKNCGIPLKTSVLESFLIKLNAMSMNKKNVLARLGSYELCKTFGNRLFLKNISVWLLLKSFQIISFIRNNRI